MFIDDIRNPPEGKKHFVIVRNAEDARKLMIDIGCPDMISFDHDLGDGETGYDVAKWMVENDLNSGGKFIPWNFKFHVHSANPIGKINIETYLTNYLTRREWQK